MTGLYRLEWAESVRRELAQGSATLMKDAASGLLLPAAASSGDTRRIIGLPRLVESGTSFLSGALAPVLAGANLVASIGNLWLTNRVRREVRSGFEQLDAAMRAEFAATQVAQARGFAETQALVSAGFAEMSSELRIIDLQLASVARTTAYGVALLSRVDEQLRAGLGGVLRSLASLATQQRELTTLLDDTLRREGERIAIRELRTSGYLLNSVYLRLHQLHAPGADFRDRARELEWVRRTLDTDVLPVLRAHAADRTDYGANVPVVLLAASAYQALATAGIDSGEQVVARQAYADGQTLLTDALRPLLSADVVPFQLFRTGIPAAQLLIAHRDALRLGELAFGESESIRENLLATAEGGEGRLSSVEFCWPDRFQTGSSATESWFQDFEGSNSVALARRMSRDPRVIAGGRYRITLGERARVAGVPGDALPKFLSQEDANKVCVLLNRVADPAEVESERQQLIGAAALGGDERPWGEVLKLANDYLGRTAGVELSDRELRALERSTVLFLAECEHVEAEAEPVPRLAAERVFDEAARTMLQSDSLVKLLRGLAPGVPQVVTLPDGTRLEVTRKVS